jgi:hypothetical protein
MFNIWRDNIKESVIRLRNDIYHHFGIAFKNNIGSPSKNGFTYSLQNSCSLAFRCRNLCIQVLVPAATKLPSEARKTQPQLVELEVCDMFASILHFHQPSRGFCQIHTT